MARLVTAWHCEPGIIFCVSCLFCLPTAVLQDFDRQQSNYAKLYRPEEHTSFTSVPMGEVITEQPIQSYGSQISTGMPSNFGRGGPATMMSPQIGIPLPGLEVLERIPSFKIHSAGKQQKIINREKRVYKTFSLFFIMRALSHVLFFSTRNKEFFSKEGEKSICENNYLPARER